MELRRLFRSKHAKFLFLLLQQAQLTLQGMEALEKFANTGDLEQAKRISDLEKDENELGRSLIDELNRNVITPIDREVLLALSRAIDDIIDYANTTVEEMTMLAIDPTPTMRKMVALLREGAEEIYLAVEQMKEHPSVANAHALRAKSVENQVAAIYREALVELFEEIDDLGAVVRVVKTRELYRRLSNAADRGDEAANIIGDIIVKLT